MSISTTPLLYALLQNYDTNQTIDAPHSKPGLTYQNQKKTECTQCHQKKINRYKGDETGARRCELCYRKAVAARCNEREIELSKHGVRKTRRWHKEDGTALTKQNINCPEKTLGVHITERSRLMHTQVFQKQEERGAFLTMPDQMHHNEVVQGFQRVDDVPLDLSIRHRNQEDDT